MFSYRHEFHAGNHADVLKHLCLVSILQYLKNKDKPFIYFDTHAGGGKYPLDSINAKKVKESEQGILKAYGKSFNSTLNNQYLTILNQALNNNEYLGSPLIAHELMRAEDRGILMEWHNNEVEILKNHCYRFEQLAIHHRDGFEGLVACLPHKIRRGLVLIDPPYERVDEYDQVITCLKASLARWQTGTYAIWYPMLTGEKSKFRQMVEHLSKLNCKSMVDIRLAVRKPSDGMYGSGMCIINPPWQFAQELELALQEMTPILAQDDYAEFTLNWLVHGK